MKGYQIKFKFGKYKDQYVSDIADKDINYIKWLIKNWNYERTKFYYVLCGYLGNHTFNENCKKYH